MPRQYVKLMRKQLYDPGLVTQLASLANLFNLIGNSCFLVSLVNLDIHPEDECLFSGIKNRIRV